MLLCRMLRRLLRWLMHKHLWVRLAHIDGVTYYGCPECGAEREVKQRRPRHR